MPFNVPENIQVFLLKPFKIPENLHVFPSKHFKHPFQGALQKSEKIFLNKKHKITGNPLPT